MIWNNITFPIKEEWRSIYFSKGYYEVSNYGRVRSLGRVVKYKRMGNVCSRVFKGALLKPKTDKDGYKEVVITTDGERVYKRVHRLVGKAFIEGYESGFVIDHIDGVKDNNMYYNLQWCTSSFNTIKYYSEEAGLHRSLSSLTRHEHQYIAYLYNSGLEYEAISENLGLGIKSVQTLWDVLSGRRLSSVTGFKKGDFMKREHPCTKMTPDEVALIIKERIIDKKPLKYLSEKYGISESMVSRFCKGTRQPKGLEIFKNKYEEMKHEI